MRYIECIRPTLLKAYRPRTAHLRAPKDALWLSGLGTGLTDHAIYRRVAAITQQAFGKPLKLHRFRTIAATTLANHRPEEVHLVSDVLGHSDQRSREWYIRANQVIAVRRSHATEDQLLHGLSGGERVRKTGERRTRDLNSAIEG
jgi:integrase/recombinase XerD